MESAYGQKKNTAVIKIFENMAGGIEMDGDR